MMDSFETVLNEYQRYIRKVALRIGSNLTTNAIDVDDLVQTGSIGLWRAFKNYDESKGEFAWYAKKLIRYGMLNHLRDFSTEPETETRELDELQDSVYNDLSMEREYLDIVNRIGRVLGRRSSRDRNLYIDYYFTDAKPAALSIKYNISGSRIRQLISRINNEINL